ncbi:MAG: hypothetical protein ONB06_06090, partial [candidate division KSB1 bacterium]|nr:hypothetical protein [candidate division KSB1 bacterium]
VGGGITQQVPVDEDAGNLAMAFRERLGRHCPPARRSVGEQAIAPKISSSSLSGFPHPEAPSYG